MSRHDAPPQVVYVYGNAPSYPQGVTPVHPASTEQGCGHGSASISGGAVHPVYASAQMSAPFPHDAHAQLLGRSVPVGGYNPHDVHKSFPARWCVYIKANFRNLLHVQQVFAVSERTARKWWNGEGGANGGYVAIAVREHPVAATQMLFAAE